jgi:hypothetical protein
MVAVLLPDFVPDTSTTVAPAICPPNLAHQCCFSERTPTVLEHLLSLFMSKGARHKNAKYVPLFGCSDTHSASYADGSHYETCGVTYRLEQEACANNFSAPSHCDDRVTVVKLLHVDKRETQMQIFATFLCEKARSVSVTLATPGRETQ